MATNAAGNERWGTRQRNLLSQQFQLFKNDPAQGYSYLAANLTNDYLQNLWATVPEFNCTSNRTFNSNYCSWAARYREKIERGGVQRAAFTRGTDDGK